MKTGDEVVSIVEKSVWTGCFGDEKIPNKGDVLTIREAKYHGRFLLLRFRELKNPPHKYIPQLDPMEYWFTARSFRKLEKYYLKESHVEFKEVKETIEESQLI